MQKQLGPCVEMINTKIRTLVTGEKGSKAMKVSESQLHVKHFTF